MVRDRSVMHAMRPPTSVNPVNTGTGWRGRAGWQAWRPAEVPGTSARSRASSSYSAHSACLLRIMSSASYMSYSFARNAVYAWMGIIYRVLLLRAWRTSLPQDTK
jgi:hypothetical protein